MDEKRISDFPTHFPMYSPWSTVSQVWHLKHHTCHCRSRATKAWPSRNWFPQPAQAPGSEGPSPDPLVAELLPTGVEASRTGIPTHRWHRAWPIDNARLVEIGQIRSTIWPRTTDSLTHTRSIVFYSRNEHESTIVHAVSSRLIHRLYAYKQRGATSTRGEEAFVACLVARFTYFRV